MPVKWPDGKRFAFTIFDDPDAQTVEIGKRVYGMLADLGFRTTRGVWPGGAIRTPNSKGASCEDIEYRQHTQHLQALGFEVGYHNHTKDFNRIDGEYWWNRFADQTSKDVILQFDTGNASSWTTT